MTAPGSVVVDPAELDVTGLVPGEAVVREVTVRNDSGVPVLLAWTRREDGALFGGCTPLGVGYAWDSDGAACDGRPVVGAGSTLDLRVEVVLPADAGDELQGAAGTSTLDWVATALPGGRCPSAGAGGAGGGAGGSAGAADAGPGVLGATGGEVGVLACAVVLLVAAGVLLLRRAVRGRSRWVVE
ncbi:hypothetical protein MHY85_09370 [Cellulomonas sp. ACRRI]|uniref:hypothetical protein n=1 Tax=Cellulomonas sp. ACRRI TaxID=2918188 RepID=UPI001EF1A881|nr:hypothetical protein [Cellulomonas sp. ACRRI]MCG7286182.1 hypothetical protein [Cellulomonas sp. ACRRI]